MRILRERLGKQEYLNKKASKPRPLAENQAFQLGVEAENCMSAAAQKGSVIVPCTLPSAGAVLEMADPCRGQRHGQGAYQAQALVGRDTDASVPVATPFLWALGGGCREGLASRQEWRAMLTCCYGPQDRTELAPVALKPLGI